MWSIEALEISQQVAMQKDPLLDSTIIHIYSMDQVDHTLLAFLGRKIIHHSHPIMLYLLVLKEHWLTR